MSEEHQQLSFCNRDDVLEEIAVLMDQTSRSSAASLIRSLKTKPKTPIFKKTHYAGVVAWIGDEEQYFALDKNDLHQWSNLDEAMRSLANASTKILLERIRNEH